MSSMKDKISAVLFCTVLGAGAVWMNFAERPTVSETEKRDLEPFPVFSPESYISGEFAEKLDKYYTDTIPARDKLAEAASVIEGYRGISSTPKFYGDVKPVDTSEEETEDETFTYVYTFTESGTQAVTTPETSFSETAPDFSVTTAPITEITVPSPTLPAETQAPVTTVPSETSNEEPAGNIGDFLNNGILVNGVEMYGKDAGVMLFGGNKKQGLRYASIINAYKEALGSDVNVYSMLVPTSAEFYLPSKYSKYSASQKDAIDYIYSELDEDIITVDAYSSLSSHTDEYIYFRTDHHWTQRGAYYAYCAFCDEAGIEPPPLTDYEERKKDGFVGSLYGYTGDITLKNSPDDFYYYIPPADFSAVAYNGKDMKYLGPTKVFHEYASGSNMYGMFLGGDNMHLVIRSDSNTGRKLVIFKESYGNALAPYFVNGFDEIYVIDIRYFGTNAVNYIKSIGATDVLFFDNIFAANTSSLIAHIEDLYALRK